ncbi:hypothetical protein AC249_AIPGENE28705 [Exaiptasia diaphana]|nr:hypothetical protein AC249_AIPGENE28705 [Exaiptasia diaphana]
MASIFGKSITLRTDDVTHFAPRRELRQNYYSMNDHNSDGNRGSDDSSDGGSDHNSDGHRRSDDNSDVDSDDNNYHKFDYNSDFTYDVHLQNIYNDSSSDSDDAIGPYWDTTSCRPFLEPLSD